MRDNARSLSNSVQRLKRDVEGSRDGYETLDGRVVFLRGQVAFNGMVGAIGCLRDGRPADDVRAVQVAAKLKPTSLLELTHSLIDMM